MLFTREILTKINNNDWHEIIIIITVLNLPKLKFIRNDTSSSYIQKYIQLFCYISRVSTYTQYFMTLAGN